MLVYYTDSTVLINKLTAILILFTNIFVPRMDVTGTENLKTTTRDLRDTTHFTTASLT